MGFEPLRYTLDFTLIIQKEDDFTDALLGLKDSLPFSSAVNKETRFGVALQTKDFPTEGKISFVPTPRDTCSIIVRRERFKVAATFNGVILAAPGLRDKNKLGKILIQSDLFKLILTNESLSFSSVDIKPETPKLDSSQWTNWYNFVLELTKEGCDIEIQPKNLKKQELKISSKITNIGSDECAEALSIIADINFVLTNLSGSAAVTYGHASIARNVESARVCAALVRGDDTITVKMSLAKQLPEGLSERSYGRFVDTIILDDRAVIAVASGTFLFDKSQDHHLITAEDLVLQEFEIVGLDKISDRIKELQSDKNAGVCMVRNLSVEDEDEPTEL